MTVHGLFQDIPDLVFTAGIAPLNQRCQAVWLRLPVSPDGCWYLVRTSPPEAPPEWTLFPLNCPGFDCPSGRSPQVITDPAQLPSWAPRPDRIPPNPPPLIPAVGPPPPFAASHPEDVRRAGAAVPPLSVDDLKAVARALGPVLAPILEAAASGKSLDLAAVVTVLIHGLGIADRIRATLGGVAPELGGKVGASIDGLAPLLASLPHGLIEGLAPPLQNLARAYSVAVADSSRLQLASDQVEGEKNREATGGLAGKLWDAAGEAAEPLLRKVMEALQHLLAKLSDKVQDVGELLVKQIGGVYRDALEARAPVTSANVNEIAGAALKNALAAGLAAQTVALGLELLHPVKRLGLNQIVGFIADFAGFSKVAEAYTGPSLKWGLQVPAEHRAASVFRTELPGAGDAREQAWQRHISLGDYAHILAHHGYPSWWVKVLVDDTFVDPRPRELSQLLEDAEADPGWLAMKLREVGWDDGDIEKGVVALLLRSTQPGRARVIAAAMKAYVQGQLQLPELQRHLDAASLRPEHQALWLRAAHIERRGDVMEALGSRMVKQYREDVTSRTTAEAQLTGLGFTPEEVSTRLLQTDLDKQVVQFREDTSEAKVQARQIQTTALTNLRTQFRAGLVDRHTLVAWGEALGYTAAYLNNVADLEQLKGPPSKAEMLPVLGVGAIQEAAATAAELLKDEVRQGRVTVLRAEAILQGLGVDPDVVHGVFKLAEVLALPSPAALGIPTPDGRGGRLGWEGVLAEILGEIHRGRAGSRLLQDVSEILGIPAAHTASRDPWLALLGEVVQGR